MRYITAYCGVVRRAPGGTAQHRHTTRRTRCERTFRYASAPHDVVIDSERSVNDAAGPEVASSVHVTHARQRPACGARVRRRACISGNQLNARINGDVAGGGGVDRTTSKAITNDDAGLAWTGGRPASHRVTTRRHQLGHSLHDHRPRL